MKKVLLLLLAVLGLARANAQGQLVKGKITDENNKPLAGATISLKGTTVRTSTDESGSFQINTGTLISPVLTISFVGYLNEDYPIKGRSDLLIHLT